MDHEHRNDINDVANSIDEFVTDKTEDLLRICHDLTACNSINPPGSTVETAQVIQDFLPFLEVHHHLFASRHVLPYSYLLR